MASASPSKISETKLKRIITGAVAVAAIALAGWMASSVFTGNQGMVPVAASQADAEKPKTPAGNAGSNPKAQVPTPVGGLPPQAPLQNTQNGRIRPLDAK